ncbi:hypothetical protein PGTUg99_006084 [Puccinia graminis f. sp. tritici]|uniref:Uncharacterized protein n=1 Tax=Puccinia graminis f. sp. tritici TaxID=56615 RepID=A0A5B0NTF9_PUCGR|nr:hypothetical protein PGTUg99_006084 [Puccinia graminis f. sp. tritici]
MNQQWSQRPFHQMENSYETRIQYLEEVVQLLISRTNSAPPPLISLPPLVSSFRYSKKRGLIPLLSQGTAEPLTIAASRTYRFNPPQHHWPPTDHLISSCLTKPPESPNLKAPSENIFKPSHPPIISSTPLASPSHSNTKLSPPSSPHPSPPSIDNRPDFSSVSLTDTRAAVSLPLSANQPDVASVSLTDTRTATIANRLDIATVSLSNTRADLLSIPPPPSLPQPKAAARPTTPPDNQWPDPTTLPETSPPIESPHGEQTKRSPIQSISLDWRPPYALTAPNPTKTPDHAPVNTISVVADESLPSSSVANTTAISATDSLSSPTPPLSSSSPTTRTPALCSLLNCKASYENFTIATMGSIAVMDDDAGSVNPHLAPDLSQAALEHYNNIDNYLKLPGMKQTKKKKKKKKKVPNSRSNSPSPSTTVDISTAAVGALAVMNEEALDALERQNDPRYRPIEDSEFVPFEDW